MSDSRDTGNTGPAVPVPIPPPGNGPGRWNPESGSRPSTATTRTARKPGVKAS